MCVRVGWLWVCVCVQESGNRSNWRQSEEQSQSVTIRGMDKTKRSPREPRKRGNLLLEERRIQRGGETQRATQLEERLS